MIIRSHVSRLRRAALTTALAGSLIAATAACSNDSSDDAKSKPTPAVTPSPSSSAKPSASPSPEVSGPHAEEKRQALAAYAAFWDEQVKAYEKGSMEGTDIRKYTGGKKAKTPAYFRLRDDLARMRDAGTRNTGAPGHRAWVSKFNAETKKSLPLAEVTDCMDIKPWKTVDEAGKVQPLPKEQPRHFQSTAKVEKWPEGWQVLEIVPSTDKCTR